jgi:hypothetical protein
MPRGVICYHPIRHPYANALSLVLRRSRLLQLRVPWILLSRAPPLALHLVPRVDAAQQAVEVYGCQTAPQVKRARRRSALDLVGVSGQGRG